MSPNRIHILRRSIAGLLFMGLSCMATFSKADQWGDWSYSSDGTNATITGYTGTCVNIVVPIMIDNLPVISIGTSAFISSPLTNITIPNTVTSIGHLAFMGCASLANITIGNGVTSIGDLAFWDCSSLAGVYFKGEMPGFGAFAFNNANNATVYYYPWTSGWTGTFGDRPTQVNPAYTQWLLDHSFATNRTEDSTDYDKDGMLNWQEFIAHTDPKTNADFLAITAMGSEASPGQIAWQAKSNVTYQVMKSSDLMGAWTNAPSGMGADQQSYQTAPMDGLLQYADPNVVGSSNAFYRVNVVP